MIKCEKCGNIMYQCGEVVMVGAFYENLNIGSGLCPMLKCQTCHHIIGECPNKNKESIQGNHCYVDSKKVL